jgi:ribosomal protein S18 acetylase RimI-like enzyme
MTSVAIRPAVPADLGQLSAIQCSELPDDPISLLGERYLSRRYFRGLLSRADAFLVADVSGEVVGYVIVGKDPLRGMFGGGGLVDAVKSLIHGLAKRPKRIVLVIDSALFLIFARRRGGPEVLWIAVSREWQGKGVGGQLLAQAILGCEGLADREMWVKTLAATPGNVKFYRQQGFRVIDERHRRVILARAV